MCKPKNYKTAHTHSFTQHKTSNTVWLPKALQENKHKESWDGRQETTHSGGSTTLESFDSLAAETIFPGAKSTASNEDPGNL